MTRKFAVCFLVLLTMACDRKPTAAEQARNDARDVAFVEKVQDQHAPIKPLTPQAVVSADIEKAGFFDAGCKFLPEGSKSAILYTQKERGLMKLAGKLIILAADSGSAEFPFATRERYTGRKVSLLLARLKEESSASGDELFRSPGSLTIRDKWERKVYRSTGMLECGDVANLTR